MPPSRENAVKAQLITTGHCKAHWTITLSEPGRCINANLELNSLKWSQGHPALLLKTIEFRVTDHYPGVEEMKGCLWPPEHLMERQGQCHCAQWVWAVIWDYGKRGYVEEVSREEVPLTNLLDQLVGIQSGVHALLSLLANR
ncbi:hypothetical protein EYZ11_012814 [Aspergillus tanneri]|uniref:Uncharacterized protein n=1 Tax=Aspergillus tanneri TaxID=1220188 RepID=A0A4S3J4N4_9EURO|nr:hypothetical protein EYZ11_012814 [Aspergillus tanneri]